MSTWADIVDSCVDKDVTERPPKEGVAYAAFAVHTPLQRNLLGLAVAHCDGDLFVVDVIREDISIADAAALLKRYGVSKVTGQDGDESDALAHAVAGVVSVLRGRQR